MSQDVMAKTQTTSLYPKHLAIVERAAERFGYERLTRPFSPTVQRILEEYAQLTNLDANPHACRNCHQPTDPGHALCESCEAEGSLQLAIEHEVEA